MNDLIAHIMRQLQNGGGTSLVPSGRGLQRTYGQFSEVPPELGGPQPTGLSPYVHDGEIRGPLRGGSVGGYKGMSGPTIEGQFSRMPEAPGAGLLDGIKGALAKGVGGAGSLAAEANPFLAAIMGAAQGDVMNKHQGFFNSPAMQIADRFGAMAPPSPQPTPAQGPAVPAGQVTSAPMSPPPNGMVAPMPFGGPGMMNPTPMANQGQPGMQPSPSFAERFGNMDHTPMPMARPPMPPMAHAHTPMPMARPAEAPQQAQPDMGFFQRNAAMMRDPVSGMFIDPTGAAQAQAGGPQLIQKMLGLLNNKASNA